MKSERISNEALFAFDLMGVIATVLMAARADAQTFTTAAEVKPILSATERAWIAMREYDGRDLIYFTNLLAWRCGASEVSCTVNDGALTPLATEPCSENSAEPNAAAAWRPSGPMSRWTSESAREGQRDRHLRRRPTEVAECQRAAVMTPSSG